ncbi:P-loop containing nucleoside triphosphate hydrolase protein [Halteromyces radiatus]|uniref:P-loop containing nucleoside triphosphate hydrolase protein n=1 Tax=Halteromyces radiatus TaxID=101107 RepID=UPI00221E47B7|nr:P-loop containing nucleoside triphosphate hydrolase protein [Halteromyces radiatus]KAI8084780.1 P-loop containing nucleoside triphosphate hydrolase protein [Halteromyces radiatus]
MECGTCRYFSGQDIETLLTWLPVNTNEEPTTTLLPCVNTKNPCTTDEDKSYRKNNDNTHRLDSTTKNRVFLVKWKDISYRHLDWVPETWLAGVSPMKYNNYLKKHYDQYPIKVEDAVPFYWKVIDRVLDTKQSQSGHVKMVFAKFRGLAYDQACWDTPPFEAQLTAPYHEALRRYRMMDSIKPVNEMKEHISILRSKLRADDFGRLRELKKQPDYVTNGTILPHQLDGLNWLIYQWEQQQPCILADDMGLGKTIQIVTFLDYLFNEYNIYPFLVVVPNSTVTNWIREFNKWAPDLVVAPYFGSSTSRDMARKYEIFRHGQQRNQISCHVVMMTYESALSGIRYFKNLDIWPYLIVDEAQRLKNMESQLFLKLAELNTDNRILLTGTPLQNNIEELFNIMHFIASSKFRDIDALTEYYREFTQDSIQELHRKLKPYFLRRTKEMVLVDLPPKKEIIVPISMTSLQKELYKETLTKGTKILAQLQKQSRGKINNKEIKKSGINYNNILMMLRKILNHPYLIPGVEIPQETQSATQQAMIDASGKLKLLKLILPKLRAQGHRVLLFSTMAIALDILEDYLVGEGIKFVRIDGNTPQLQRVTNMDIFNASDSDVDVFLLTSRAGGVGINLATADTVIIYDSDYNPHVDLQAISRAHRMGQKSPVLILRFATRLSVEESILNKAKKKMVLDHLVVDKMDEEEIEPDDIESIVKFGLKALFDEDDGPEDIVYDSAAVDELLDRDAQFKADTPSSSTTDTMDPATDDTTKDKKENGFMSFSFAKIWQKQKGPVDAQNDNLMQVNGEENQGKPDNADDDNVWERLLAKNREALEEEKLQQAEKLGRGARQRKVIVKFSKKKKKKKKKVLLLLTFFLS